MTEQHSKYCSPAEIEAAEMHALCMDASIKLLNDSDSPDYFASAQSDVLVFAHEQLLELATQYGKAAGLYSGDS